MRRIRVSRAARSDLDEIWFFISQDNEEAANRVIGDITARFIMIRRQPRIGRARAELRPGIRSFGAGKYLIYYRVGRGAIEIVRVLHSARDVGGIFRD